MPHLVIAALFLILSLFSTPGAQASPQSDFDRGMMLYGQGKYVDAYTPLVSAAKAGHAKAAFNLGVMFETKQIEAKVDSEPDYDQSAYWYDQAARNGHAAGQYRIGLHFMKGRGVAQNRQSAQYWFTKSAAQNYQPAMAIKAFLRQAETGSRPMYLIHKWTGAPQAAAKRVAPHHRWSI